MVELDRLVKLLVEKMLRTYKEQKQNGSGTDEGKTVRQQPQERVSEGTAKDATDKKMPEG